MFEVHGDGLGVDKKFKLVQLFPIFPGMGVRDAANHGRKRKQVNEDAAKPAALFDAENLEMLSDEEDGVEEAASDDGYVDEFPEIDAGSDSEDNSTETSDDENVSGSDEEDEEDSLHSDDNLHIFPQVKTIISDITGQEKRVYPEIEPEYDSDSSTEDVRLALLLVHRV